MVVDEGLGSVDEEIADEVRERGDLEHRWGEMADVVDSPGVSVGVEQDQGVFGSERVLKGGRRRDVSRKGKTQRRIDSVSRVRARLTM